MRLHKSAASVRVVEQSVRALDNCHVERFEEEAVSFHRLNLHIRVRFAKGYLLEVNEALLIEEGKVIYLGYRYHFQDEENRLIFRYDDKPHFRTIKTFPHHKHLSSEVISCVKPKIQEVIEEARQFSNKTE